MFFNPPEGAVVLLSSISGNLELDDERDEEYEDEFLKLWPIIEAAATTTAAAVAAAMI
jgi:hypothetical protein